MNPFMQMLMQMLSQLMPAQGFGQMQPPQGGLAPMGGPQMGQFTPAMPPPPQPMPQPTLQPMLQAATGLGGSLFGGGPPPQPAPQQWSPEQQAEWFGPGGGGAAMPPPQMSTPSPLTDMTGQYGFGQPPGQNRFNAPPMQAPAAPPQQGFWGGVANAGRELAGRAAPMQPQQGFWGGVANAGRELAGRAAPMQRGGGFGLGQVMGGLMRQPGLQQAAGRMRQSTPMSQRYGNRLKSQDDGFDMGVG